MGDPIPGGPAALEAAIELEKQKELELFRLEIEKIKAARKDIDGTIAAVDTASLEKEEKDFWNIYKDILGRIDIFFSSLDWSSLLIIKQNQDNQLKNFSDSLSDLAVLVKDQMKKTDNESRKQFMAWVINRVGILLADIDFINHEDCLEEDFINIKDLTLVHEKNIVSIGK